MRSRQRWRGERLTPSARLPAHAGAACDLSAGGSIYVPNKQEPRLSTVPPHPDRSLSKEIRWLALWHFVAETQNPICEEETSNQTKMEGV